MSKAKHTPGPWLFDAGSIYAECQIINGETIESPLAELLSGRQENWEQNGLLIAAAPEMLAELQNMLNEMRGRKLCGHDFRCICSAARLGRVIDKATGGRD